MVTIETTQKAGLEHVLTTEMVVKRSIVEVFEFFADATNLERITPPELNFSIVSKLPIHMSMGTTIDYRLSLFGFPIRWKTLIPVWSPPYQFTDIQTSGPYAQWIHQHLFEDLGGGTRIRDRVLYKLPFGRIGAIGHPLIGMQLKRIFRYRLDAIREFFGENG